MTLRYLLLLLLFTGTPWCFGAPPPVALRAEHFIVPPSTGPVTHVVVRNLLNAPYEGTISLKLPVGWQCTPAESPVALDAHETRRVPFTIEKASDVAANVYLVTAVAISADTQVLRKQQVVCASVPYFKPKIDGNPKEWEDAIPVTFLSGGKKTVFRSYWNKRAFCLLVEVEEAQFQGYSEESNDTALDAIQIALAVRTAITGTSPQDKTDRYEFLITGAAAKRAADQCYCLATPGMPLSVTREKRKRAPLVLQDAQVVVKHKKGITTYECAIPFAAMPKIKPSEGREFRFSLLVHDPDGTGIRDWGKAAGLWPSQRNAFAWSAWDRVEWGSEVPYDSKIEWGLCSSKH